MSLKKVFSFLLSTLLILCVFGSNTFAEEPTQRKNDPIHEVSTAIAEQFIEQNNQQFEVASSEPLYDGTNTVKGYLFHLRSENTNGYLIVYSIRGVLKVTEANFEKDRFANEDGKIFYNGLMDYDILKDGTLRNMFSGNIVPFSALNRFDSVDLTASREA